MVWAGSACRYAVDSERRKNVSDPATVLTEEERQARIRLDFTRTRDEVVQYIQRYYSEVTDTMLTVWEQEKSLEVMILDGEKRYFRNAGPNLFRIDPEARKVKLEKDGSTLSSSEKVNRLHLPQVMEEIKANGDVRTSPVRMRVKYALTVLANAVPAGETIRCWLPYPREDNRRQTDVKLLSVNEDEYVIAPDESLHRTLYVEKKAVKDKPTRFEIEFSYASAAEWFRLSEDRIKPYDRKSELYRRYTAERSSHIIFTEDIKTLSAKIVGEEKHPLRIVRKLFAYIDRHYPWASAREYSTVSNIPQYVIENRHGDCGMVSLLFITLARYNGIPAKWQSGFMMHPGAMNLHDWAEVYFEGVGWVPVDQSFGCPSFATDDETRLFFSNGIDAYRWIVNDDFSAPLVPAKRFPRSETVDFQRGEVEWAGGNLYFDQWYYTFDVEYSD